MEKAKKVFKLAELQKIDPQLFLTRINEGTFELPEFPGLIFHYEGLNQTVLNYIYAEANGNIGLVTSLAGQCGLIGMTVNGERMDVDCDRRYMGLNRDIQIHTVVREDWDGLSFAIQQAIGLKVLEASSLTEEERVKLNFTPPSQNKQSGDNVNGSSQESPDVINVTENGPSTSELKKVSESKAKDARSNSNMSKKMK